MINYNAQNKCKIMYIVARNASTQLNKIIKRKEKKKKERKRDLYWFGTNGYVHSSKQEALHPLLWNPLYFFPLTGREETFTKD